MIYTLHTIAAITKGRLLSGKGNDAIQYLLFDSRKVYYPEKSIFFAIKTTRRDGHSFIPELYNAGVRNFIIEREIDISKFSEANILLVKNVTEALHELAIYHRKQFKYPVIGITGSNGKTIVKEWLYQLLHSDYDIVRSPKSYNSQIGVPVSVWEMNEKYNLGIFEAGISEPGEMEKLAAIIQPTIGILTNIGDAHNTGFSSKQQKLQEKWKLFSACKIIIYNKSIIENVSIEPDQTLLSWSTENKAASLFISKTIKDMAGAILTAVFDTKETKISIPFNDDASVENAITCWLVLLHLQIDDNIIKKRMLQLTPVNMRLELKKGNNNCSIINDSYSADFSSLQIALHFLQQQSGDQKRTVILSDFFQKEYNSGLYQRIMNELKKAGAQRLITIGPEFKKFSETNNLSVGSTISVMSFLSVPDFINDFKNNNFRDECILIKGARAFEFEKIVSLLEKQVHNTVLEINLNAITHNLKVFQQKLLPGVKLMAMVKAFAYGSGAVEIGSILQFHKTDYLTVAYADEGMELRKAGITLPIMVMNPEESAFGILINFNLEPEMFSLHLLQSFINYLDKEGIKNYPIHLELETGMNRLGLSGEDISAACDIINKSGFVKIRSVFSHLAASEEKANDDFTNEQFEKFKSYCNIIESKIDYSFIKHISNTAAIIRHPEMQLDMVRLGIGLYGIEPGGHVKLGLQPAATLKSTIAQIKYLKKGESVGYSRKGKVEDDKTIATIRMGYADGYSRKMGNGNGKMLVKGKLAPVIGSVCMDMTMIDITNIPNVSEGDDVTLFGEGLPIEDVAKWGETIPYEIMTSISQRVKRTYYEE